MANGPTLPPQAYTREILTSAFNWLQSQPDSVRKLATTPDALVGLFLRAQRFGSTSLEADAPVSSVNFVSDLKQLAEGLKQFEEPKAKQTKTEPRPNPQYQLTRDLTKDTFRGPQASMPSMAHSAQPSAYPTQPSMAQSAHPAQSNRSEQVSRTHESAVPLNDGFDDSPMSEEMPPRHQSTPLVSWSGLLNENTYQMIREVKTRLNLSSEAEVINMMSALAYKSLKDLLV